jgi:hypothetical protein
MRKSWLQQAQEVKDQNFAPVLVTALTKPFQTAEQLIKRVGLGLKMAIRF